MLRTETESLRVQYLEMTAKWAANEFKTLRAWAQEYRTGKHGFGAASKKYWKLPACIINEGGKIEEYTAKALKASEAHYLFSIEKLAARIEKKGLDQSKLSVVTAHVGVNINTTLTDGNKTVRAFTIIAQGEVQRPHYRYLVK